jgi:hypothetical protein
LHVQQDVAANDAASLRGEMLAAKAEAESRLQHLRAAYADVEAERDQAVAMVRELQTQVREPTPAQPLVESEAAVVSRAYRALEAELAAARAALAGVARAA